MKKITTLLAALLATVGSLQAAECGTIQLAKGANCGYINDLTSKQITIETWVEIPEAPSGWIFSSLGANLGFGLGFDGWAKFQVGNTAVWVDPTTWKNKWVHIACVADGTDLIVYANGVKVANTPKANGFEGTNPTSALWLSTDAWNTTFKGKIAQFRVWNVARTATEIAENYKIQLPATTTGLYILYNFEEKSGESFANLVNGNNRGWIVEGAANATWGIFTEIPTTLNIGNKQKITCIQNGESLQINGIEGEAFFTLYTPMGNQVISQSIENNGTISLNGINTGIYIVEINNQGSRSTYKINIK